MPRRGLYSVTDQQLLSGGFAPEFLIIFAQPGGYMALDPFGLPVTGDDARHGHARYSDFCGKFFVLDPVSDQKCANIAVHKILLEV
jgi:hypothetical protein